MKNQELGLSGVLFFMAIVTAIILLIDIFFPGHFEKEISQKAMIIAIIIFVVLGVISRYLGPRIERYCEKYDDELRQQKNPSEKTDKKVFSDKSF